VDAEANFFYVFLGMQTDGIATVLGSSLGAPISVRCKWLRSPLLLLFLTVKRQEVGGPLI
jgi:hypothetical protein